MARSRTEDRAASPALHVGTVSRRSA